MYESEWNWNFRGTLCFVTLCFLLCLCLKGLSMSLKGRHWIAFSLPIHDAINKQTFITALGRTELNALKISDSRLRSVSSSKVYIANFEEGWSSSGTSQQYHTPEFTRGLIDSRVSLRMLVLDTKKNVLNDNDN